MADGLWDALRFVVVVALLVVVWFAVSLFMVLTSRPYWPLGRVVAAATAMTLSTLERWALWLGAGLVVTGLRLLTGFTLASLFE